MNYIILNGVNSQTLDGFLIQSLPPITKPAMRTEVTELDGKDGDIVTNLGYAAYDKVLSVGLYGNYDIDEIIAFFNSSGTVIFSNEKDKVYKYTIVQQIDFERLIRFRTAEVTLHVQPFKFSLAEQPLTFQPVTTNGEGTTITLQPTASGEVLSSIALYGSSRQSGTPTTANPVNIDNVTGSLNVRFANAGATQTENVTLSLSRLELCKVGSYQDNIHKEGDAWVKYTAIQKFTVDTANVTIQTYRNVTYAVIPAPTNALCYGNYKDIPCLCTHAAYSYGLPEGWNTVNAINKIFCQADANTFWLGMTAGTTLEQAQAALTDCVIYYVLLDKLNKPLASAGLQEQLNSLLEVSLFDGSTTIGVNNVTVPPIISATAINEAFAVRNTGNVYARPKITIDGVGTITVTVNGQQIFTVEMDGEITIDGAALEAYQGTPDNLKNRNVTGSYDNFVFPIGRNIIEFSGELTQVTIENYSRWL